ncbi:hypothetical protein CORMATOL_01111 [Corynebacterium matruchotii ATCC 33806]|uniref:Uncharacterized protein n=1 Tax=Corynebacterium matruchotii ATCC 33806 TaxID=566549 RepID=C0E2A6_9CORY|nr:hypothetical protein CORMATOL_01111 [Corynebacterium matruchotii ATCC 33806]
MRCEFVMYSYPRLSAAVWVGVYHQSFIEHTVTSWVLPIH